MRRFSIAFFTTLLAGFALLWLGIACDPVALMNPHDASTLGKLSLIDHCQLGSTAIMGDSGMVYGLLPSALGPGVTNVALGGITPIEYYLLARRVMACPHPPKTILLSFSIETLEIQRGFLDYITQKYGIFGFSELDSVREYARQRVPHYYGATSPGDIDIRMREAGYVYRFPLYYASDIASSHRRYKHSAFYYDETIRTHGEWLLYGNSNGSQELSASTRYDHFIPLVLWDDYLERAISLLEYNGVTVYYVIFPVSDVSMPKINPQLIADYMSYLDGYVRKHPNFHLLTPGFTTLPWTMFYDPNHLNRKGAETFSAYIRDKLNAIGAGGGPFFAVPDNATSDKEQ